MYDNVYSEYPLPNKEVQAEEFQTKDFDRFMDKYIISKEGRLYFRHLNASPVPEMTMVDMNFHGVMNFYTLKNDKWFEYNAKFSHGQLKEITRINER